MSERRSETPKEVTRYATKWEEVIFGHTFRQAFIRLTVFLVLFIGIFGTLFYLLGRP